MARRFTKTPASHLGCEAPWPKYPYAVSLWFRVADVESDHLLFARAAWNNWDNRDEIVVKGSASGDPVQATVYRQDGNRAYALAQPVTAGRWHHVAVVFHRYQVLYLWLDGVLGAAMLPWLIYADPFPIDRLWLGGGRDGWTVQASSDSQLAEVAVWTVSDLSADEIGALAGRLCPLRIRTASLRAYWPLGGLYGRNDRDRWRRWDLTPAGGPQWADHPTIGYGRTVDVARRAPVLLHAPYRSAAGRVWHTGALAGCGRTAGAQAGTILNHG